MEEENKKAKIFAEGEGCFQHIHNHAMQEHTKGT